MPLPGLDVSVGPTRYGSTSAPQGAILGENMRQELALPCSVLCTHWLHSWLPGVSEWGMEMFVSCCVCMWGTVPENSINGSSSVCDSLWINEALSRLPAWLGVSSATAIQIHHH